MTNRESSVILIEKACGLTVVRRIVMHTVVTVICCLIPCIGIALGLMFMQKGKKKKGTEAASGGGSAELVRAVGTRILAVAAALLVITVLVLSFAPMGTARTRLVAAILVVTVQYAAAIVLIFSINGMLKKDKLQRTESQEKENV